MAYVDSKATFWLGSIPATEYSEKSTVRAVMERFDIMTGKTEGHRPTTNLGTTISLYYTLSFDTWNPRICTNT